MPYRYEWVDAEVALEHAGVKIWHAYNDDDWDHCLDYWFSVTNDAEGEFDVREIPGFDEKLKNFNETLAQAIDNGWLTQDGLTLPGTGGAHE